jgi:hypothetical protein
MRTSELRASSPSFVSPRASLRVSMTAAGGDEAGMGSPYATSAATGGGASGGGAGSLPSSPLASGGGAVGGSGSFAFRRSSVYRATSDGMDGYSSPTQGGAYMQVCVQTTAAAVAWNYIAPVAAARYCMPVTCQRTWCSKPLTSRSAELQACHVAWVAIHTQTAKNHCQST